MGTNYYWHSNPGRVLSRVNRLHVGKSSAGWSFGFRAYPQRLLNSGHPEWGYGSESPVGFAVLSRVDWLRVFTARPGVLVSENGGRVDDPVAWINELTAPSQSQQAREDMWRRTPMDGVREWRDAEGFHFCDGEFC